jgi:hypothetical protein
MSTLNSANVPASPPPKPTSVPLAHDDYGRPLAAPSQAAFWRVRRHTRGRPRNVTGADRQPLRVPLDFTADDLDAMLGAGTYRLDLCDVAGEPLGMTVMVPIGDDESATANANAARVNEDAPCALPASASDVRLVLEANVRATQLAFAHNERTLMASLRMADTLRDGIRDLASAQASWINSLASARGFFRNAQPTVVSVAPAKDSEGDEEDDRDDEEGEEEVNTAATNIYDVLMPFAEQAAPMLPVLAGGVFGAKPATEGVVAQPVAQNAEAELAAKPFEVRELIDLNYAAEKGRAKKAAKARAAQSPAAQPAMPLQARIKADPQLYARMMAVKELLLSAEVAELLKLAAMSTDSEQQSLIDVINQYSPEQAVRVVRHVLNGRRANGTAQMRITPVRSPASEAIPSTPPEPIDPTTPLEP